MTQQLLDSGYSQGALARAITESGVNCSQPTVWRILNGADPSYTVGDAIRRLHESVVGSNAA